MKHYFSNVLRRASRSDYNVSTVGDVNFYALSINFILLG